MERIKCQMIILFEMTILVLPSILSSVTKEKERNCVVSNQKSFLFTQDWGSCWGWMRENKIGQDDYSFDPSAWLFTFTKCHFLFYSLIFWIDDRRILPAPSVFTPPSSLQLLYSLCSIISWKEGWEALNESPEGKQQLSGDEDDVRSDRFVQLVMISISVDCHDYG